MKRVILTGYPYKINKRKAVVRLMFFNPQDVRYFKPVDLITKLGLRVKFFYIYHNLINIYIYVC